MPKTQMLYIRFLFSISISGDSSSYFLEMIMLIGSVGNMTQTKIIVGKKTYTGLGLNVSSLLQYVQYWGLCHREDDTVKTYWPLVGPLLMEITIPIPYSGLSQGTFQTNKHNHKKPSLQK